MKKGAREQWVKSYYDLLEKSLLPFLKSGVSPNAISFLALTVSLLAGICYGYGKILAGGLFLLVSGFLDTVDGSIARLRGRPSRFGALLDSTLDRYAEFFVFFGILVHFRSRWMFFLVLFALMGSVMVSYIKARAQSLGDIRTVGLMQRPERLALLILGSILNEPARMLYPNHPDALFSFTLILLAVLSNGTAIHRILAGKKDLTAIPS